METRAEWHVLVVFYRGGGEEGETALLHPGGDETRRQGHRLLRQKNGVSIKIKDDIRPDNREKISCKASNNSGA